MCVDLQYTYIHTYIFVQSLSHVRHCDTLNSSMPYISICNPIYKVYIYINVFICCSVSIYIHTICIETGWRRVVHKSRDSGIAFINQEVFY